jgi:cation diffusion facilitator family transporter
VLGAAVGTDVDGPLVGAADGCDVLGAAVGTDVLGDAVGEAVGCDVLGAAVGIDVDGPLVGAADGCDVSAVSAPKESTLSTRIFLPSYFFRKDGMRRSRGGDTGPGKRRIAAACGIASAVFCRSIAAVALVAVARELTSATGVSASNGTLAILAIAALLLLTSEARKLSVGSAMAQVARSCASRALSHAACAVLLVVRVHLTLVFLGSVAPGVAGPLCIAVLHGCEPLFVALLRWRRAARERRAELRRESRHLPSMMESGGTRGAGGGPSAAHAEEEYWTSGHLAMALALACALWPMRTSPRTVLAVLLASLAGAAQSLVAASIQASVGADDRAGVDRAPSATHARRSAAVVSTTLAALLALVWDVAAVFVVGHGATHGVGAAAKIRAEIAACVAACLAAAALVGRAVDVEEVLAGRRRKPGRMGFAAAAAAGSAHERHVAAKLGVAALFVAVALANALLFGTEVPATSMVLAIGLCYCGVHARLADRAAWREVRARLSAFGGQQRASGAARFCARWCGGGGSGARGGVSPRSSRRERGSATGGARACCGVRTRPMVYHVRRLLAETRTDRASCRIVSFLALNIVVMLAELGVGVLSNSLGLVSDAGHMLFDSSALFIGLVAAYVARWPADQVFGYGYGRVEVSCAAFARIVPRHCPAVSRSAAARANSANTAVQHACPPRSRCAHDCPPLAPTARATDQLLSGFVNGLFLIVVAFSVLNESIERVYAPPDVHTEHVLPVAIVGLVTNLIGLAFFHDLAHGHADAGKGSGAASALHIGHVHGPNGECALEDARRMGGMANANIAGIFLHVLADTLGSVGLVVSTLLIRFKGWRLADPICATAIAVLIIAATVPLLVATGGLLLNSVPPALAPALAETRARLEALGGVESVDDVRFWCHASGRPMMTVRLYASDAMNDQQVRRECSCTAHSALRFALTTARTLPHDPPRATQRLSPPPVNITVPPSLLCVCSSFPVRLPTCPPSPRVSSFGRRSLRTRSLW